jgi:hypothetical protein
MKRGGSQKRRGYGAALCLTEAPPPNYKYWKKEYSLSSFIRNSNRIVMALLS